MPEVATAMAEGPSAGDFSDSDGEAAAGTSVRQSRRIAGPGSDDGGHGGSAGKGRPGSGASQDAWLRSGALVSASGPSFFFKCTLFLWQEAAGLLRLMRTVSPPLMLALGSPTEVATTDPLLGLCLTGLRGACSK